MPTHEPELSEPYYGGDFYDGGTYDRTPPGATIQYFHTEDDGYSYDPDAPGEVEWLTEAVAAGPDVGWSDDAERRRTGEAILRHYFAREPTRDELDTFMEEIAPSLQDGQPFAIGTDVLRNAGLDR